MTQGFNDVRFPKKMTPPKKIYISNTEAWESLVKSDLRNEYISVDALKEFVYCNYGAIDFMTQFDKFIEE